MTKNRKLLIVILIIATIALAGISAVISIALRNQNLDTQTGAQTTNILSNCDTTTGTCTIPTGVCNPAKVYVHFCSDLKRDNEKCVSASPTEIPGSPISAGKTVDINDYLKGANCGTVQLYMELQNSGVNSLGACGTVVKKFTTACGATTPTTVASYPVSSPVSYTAPQTTNTGSNTNTNTNTNGTTQLANPQFSISSSFTATCENSGDALLKYTLSVSNISTVSGTITKVEEVISGTYGTNAITPTNISNSGTIGGNKITWAESSNARTYSAGQTKTYTYEIRIPVSKLSLFTNNATSTSTVTYDTSSATGNTNTFVLASKHACAIPTTNTTTTTTQLPNTALSDDFKLVLIGFGFILIALIIFRFQIGEDTIANILGSTYRRRKNS